MPSSAAQTTLNAHCVGWLPITELERFTIFLPHRLYSPVYWALWHRLGYSWGLQRLAPLDRLASKPLDLDIAHALIATAVGLAAAIPAVIGFNSSISAIRYWPTNGKASRLISSILLAQLSKALVFIAKEVSMRCQVEMKMASYQCDSFVDVMLVLLIIFMVTAPMMNQGQKSICQMPIQIHCPQTR